MLFIAQGFGLGKIPFAPGTLGSILGLLWFTLLLASGKVWGLLGGTLIGLAFSVWLCDAAEKTLGLKDPSSVVLDELTAMPICFFSWSGIYFSKTGALPGVEQLVANHNWMITLGIFLAFRLFDVIKPWPVRQSQSLQGGWGITVDDVLAAIYVSALYLAVHIVRIFLPA